MKQIVLALQNYSARNGGSLPPAYVSDENGRPLYSWRVLILPYLDEATLYREFHLDEPWDSPHNRVLAETDLRFFRCPSDEASQAGSTNYVAVVGPETVWPGAETTSFDDITDGMTNTILLVEVTNLGIHWAEPRDLQMDQMAPRINSPTGQGISSEHPHSVNVFYADGHGGSLSQDLSAEEVRALLTRAGGETLHSE